MSDGLGVLGGAGTGAKLGGTIGSMFGPTGTVVGTGLGAVIGGFTGGIIGGKRKAESDEALASIMAIPEVDPNMVDFKDQLMREKRMIDAGLSTPFQVARDIALQSEAGGLSVAAELAMTNPALGLMAMNQIAGQTDLTVNKALGTLSTQSMGYTQLLGEFVDKISQREFDVQRMKAAQKMAIATAREKDFNANMWAGVMKGLDFLTGLEGIKLPRKSGEGIPVGDVIPEVEPIGGPLT